MLTNVLFARIEAQPWSNEPDDGYENDPTYGPPNGMSLHEGMPIMHKYVQRYLKFHTELSAATSNQGIAMRIERDLVDMEERMSSEFEHGEPTNAKYIQCKA